MANTKLIKVPGNDTPIPFKASAATPRMYRLLFKKDIFADLQQLAKAAQEAGSEDSNGFEVKDLEIFENVAYVMAKSANPDIGDIDSWLDSYEMFSIYEILPEILALWGENMFTMTQPAAKKK